MASTFINQIDSAIQQGRGAAASVLGQQYDVRRLTGSTNVAISSNAPVITAFPARVRRTTSKQALENNIFDLMAYEATCDARSLQINDQLTETGYGSTGAVFVVAQKRPTRETIFMRAEFNVSITRPIPSAGSAAQQPSYGVVATAGYSGFTKAGEEVLTLVNGLYAFSSEQGAIPASLQAGLSQTSRLKDARKPGIAVPLYREEYFIYLPLFPGEQLTELDRIAFGNGDRYEVGSVYPSDQTGIVGWVSKVEKLSN